METTKSRCPVHNWGTFSILQLLIGGTITAGAITAILRLSNIWTLTDARYVEYAVILFWGIIFMFGAVRHRFDRDI